MPSGDRWWGVTPPPPRHTHTHTYPHFFEMCRYFMISYHEKRNAGFYQYLASRNQNNECLAVKYILHFLPTISCDVCNVMFINEQKR